RGFAAHHAVPPGADAGGELVVALDHVHRLTQSGRGGLDADVARLDAFFRCHPQPVVAPHARAPGDRFGLPVVDFAGAAAPGVIDHEARRRVGIEPGARVVDVAAARHADAVLLGQRQVVALPDVVQAE